MPTATPDQIGIARFSHVFSSIIENMRACKSCGSEVSGRGRQYCPPCSIERKKQTNSAYWQRAAEDRPTLTCERCSAPYQVRPGNPTLRQFCQPCALKIRAESRKVYDRARWPNKAPRDPQRLRGSTREYKLSHPEWNRAQTALYKRRHPVKVREWVNRRRAVRAGAEGRVTIAEFWAKCEATGWICTYCPEVLTKDTATMDHVIPLSRGGADSIENIVPACRSCNARKGNRLP